MGLKLDISTSNEWHILKSETQYGPYTYEDMLRMLQNKTLFDFDYVWSPHLQGWTQLSELAEFSVDRISRLAEKVQESKVFIDRAHERANCSWPVYAHNNKILWNGTAESISLGGALILMDNPVLLPGDIITVHFRGNENIKENFNTKAEVLNKRLVKGKVSHDTNIRYVLKFTQVQNAGEKQINLFIKSTK